MPWQQKEVELGVVAHRYGDRGTRLTAVGQALELIACYAADLIAHRVENAWAACAVDVGPADNYGVGHIPGPDTGPRGCALSAATEAGRVACLRVVRNRCETRNLTLERWVGNVVASLGQVQWSREGEVEEGRSQDGGDGLEELHGSLFSSGLLLIVVGGC